MIKERHAALHWMVQPGRTMLPGVSAHLRTVRPWNEWVMAAIGPGGVNPFEGLTKDSPEVVEFVKRLIGDDSTDVQILELGRWTVRETFATEYRKQGTDVFLLGDAAHRHPPTFGLGSNTAIQDAYNLAWKVAYVLNRWAGPGLLNTYSPERQPIGENLVRESNNQIRANSSVWESLGMTSPPGEGEKCIDELKAATAKGSARREKLHTALEDKRQELESLGLAYNHWYTSNAVYLDDEKEPRPTLEGDPIVNVQESTYPGSRLPHVWLDLPVRRKRISTQDLAGKGAFCLLTSVGGESWRLAAEQIKKDTGIPISIYGIGPGLDYADIHREWYRKRGTGDEGCVLVRPDRFVAWRSFGRADDCERKLRAVLDAVLVRHEL